jgi:hypothetical protein
MKFARKLSIFDAVLFCVLTWRPTDRLLDAKQNLFFSSWVSFPLLLLIMSVWLGSWSELTANVKKIRPTGSETARNTTIVHPPRLEHQVLVSSVPLP